MTRVFPFLGFIRSSHPKFPMPEDTQDDGRSLCTEAKVTLLRTADERMLHDSGNLVYHRLKAEVNQLQ
jgi:hypothetical protein